MRPWETSYSPITARHESDDDESSYDEFEEDEELDEDEDEDDKEEEDDDYDDYEDSFDDDYSEVPRRSRRGDWD
ncbi:MAG: hypothetical protein OEO20_12400 [Gemmatimonadota bacterium]|nr:hypothetical protein [Gemmatimonadota bacterium]MDH3366467.1 hypothetical protein [Gemmatimonadota bacterium]MDH3479094.1 hypothetical protein [Gemmatimonadota bacterium]MDH5549209.1 hypothetical protein [Gemmatimonadota bacterium]